ncbi:hypothetical protein FOL47_002232, partial [Perkinsus chesapeaki]
VKKSLYLLHTSPTDEVYRLLCAALREEAGALSETAETYLKETLNPDKYGYPNLFFSAEGLMNAQVTTNIVESWHKKISTCLNEERLNLAQFVDNIVKILEDLHEGPHFVKRPMKIQQTGYTTAMKIDGTRLSTKGYIKEVTDVVETIFDEEDIQSTFFIVRSGIISKGEDDFSDDSVTDFLTCLFEGETGIGVEDLNTVEDIKRRYFKYHLISVPYANRLQDEAGNVVDERVMAICNSEIESGIRQRYFLSGTCWVCAIASFLRIVYNSLRFYPNRKISTEEVVEQTSRKNSSSSESDDTILAPSPMTNSSYSAMTRSDSSISNGECSADIVRPIEPESSQAGSDDDTCYSEPSSAGSGFIIRPGDPNEGQASVSDRTPLQSCNESESSNDSRIIVFADPSADKAR